MKRIVGIRVAMIWVIHFRRASGPKRHELENGLMTCQNTMRADKKNGGRSGYQDVSHSLEACQS